MNAANSLPKNWELKKLGEVCFTTSGGTPSRKNPMFYGGNIPWVKSGELNKGIILDTEEKITADAVKNSSAKVFPKGTLLIALYGATIGKLAFLGIDAATNQAICGIYENENVLSKFLSNFLYFKRPSLVKEGIGGAQPNISQGILKNLQLPLPPIDEQEQIVAKIEELFSELDAGVESLKKAQAQLKTYRQAVLKSAFEGKLTNENSVRDWADTFGGYAFKSGEFKSNGKYQVLRMGNVRPGIVRLHESPVFIDEIDENTLNRSLLKPGDIIITQTGTRKKRDYGFTAQVAASNLLLNQRLASIRFRKGYLPKFFLYFSWTNLFKDQFFANETGNVGQGNVGMRAVTETKIPYCPIDEQQRIIEEIESRLSVCDKLEETIAASLKQSEALRQSILKQAFEGKLVKHVAESKRRKPNEQFERMRVLAFILQYLGSKGFRPKQMASAKYVYLIEKIFGVPIYKEYRRLHLGPYSPEIKKNIFNKTYFSHTSSGIDVLSGDKLFKYPIPNKDVIEAAINEIATTFSKYSRSERSHKIELLATVCKVIEDIGSTEVAAVRQSMREWPIDLKDSKFRNKAEKFDESETVRCVKFILRKGWDKRLIGKCQY